MIIFADTSAKTDTVVAALAGGLNNRFPERLAVEFSASSVAGENLVWQDTARQEE